MDVEQLFSLPTVRSYLMESHCHLQSSKKQLQVMLVWALDLDFLDERKKIVIEFSIEYYVMLSPLFI